MGMWDLYQSRVDAHGGTKRGATLEREYRFLNTKLPDSLSYHTAEIYPSAYGYNITSQEAQEHKITQNVAIINSDNLNEKSIFSLPHEDIKLGSLVYWMENYWLVSERDANTTVYTRAKLIQCNHLLKWISRDTRQIIEQWCVVDDGTKLTYGTPHTVVWHTGNGMQKEPLELLETP